MWSSSDSSGVESDEDVARPKRGVGILRGIFSDFEMVKSRPSRSPRSKERGNKSEEEDAGRENSATRHAQRIAHLERENKELRLALLKESLRPPDTRELLHDRDLSCPVHVLSDGFQPGQQVHVASTTEASAPVTFTMMAMSSGGEEEEDETRRISRRRNSTVKLFEMDWRYIPTSRRTSKSLYYSGGEEDALKHLSQEAAGADCYRKLIADTGGIDSDGTINPRSSKVLNTAEDSHWKALNQLLSELPNSVRKIIREQLDRYQAEIKYLQSVIAAYEEMYLNSSFQWTSEVLGKQSPTRRRASHSGCYSFPLVNPTTVGARPSSPLPSFSRTVSPNSLNHVSGTATGTPSPLPPSSLESELIKEGQGLTQAGQEWKRQMDKKAESARLNRPRRNLSNPPSDSASTTGAPPGSSQESCPVS